MPVDFAMASYLSPFLSGAVDKAWGDLCGAPSSGKTEILMSLKDDEGRSVFRDDMTENAFGSSFRDEDNPKDVSLAKALSNETDPKGPKVLIIKDLTSILSMRPEKVLKFFGDMRTAYDGSFCRAAGNIGIDDKGTMGFGLITACTEKLDDYKKINQALGERNLVCRVGRHLQSYKTRRTILSSANARTRQYKEDLRKRINTTTVETMRKAMEGIATTTVTRSAEMETRLQQLSVLATSIRTSPVSNRTYASTGEGPFRFLNQILAWGDARVVFDGRTEWNESDYSLVRRICQDTMMPENLRAIQGIWRGGVRESLAGMPKGDIMYYSRAGETMWRQLKQWHVIDVLVEHQDGVYGLNPEVAKDIEATGFMEGLDGV